MSSTVQALFERYYAEQIGSTVEQIQGHRWKNHDGYELPEVNKAYRHFQAGYEAANPKALADGQWSLPSVNYQFCEPRMSQRRAFEIMGAGKCFGLDPETGEVKEIVGFSIEDFLTGKSQP